MRKAWLVDVGFMADIVAAAIWAAEACRASIWRRCSEGAKLASGRIVER
jgi:hypothetical protein